MIRKALTVAMAVSLSAAPALAVEGNPVRASAPMSNGQQFVGGKSGPMLLAFLATIGAVAVALTLDGEPASP